MGALTKKRNRSIDSLWRGNDSLIAAVEAAVGLPIGSDDGVLFIQDVGTKVVGRAYIDKNNGKMYRCVVGTTSVSNDSNFEMIGIGTNSEILQDLSKVDVVNVTYDSEYINDARCFAIGKVIVLNFMTKPNITIPINTKIIFFPNAVQNARFVLSDYQTTNYPNSASSRCILDNNNVRIPNEYVTSGASYGQCITYII
ncbi:MAG: hypothetical protein ACRCXX_12005 [Cetobacterium sp.]|uniref:hypothetical protein n=1 Tax=Cetobacterium sp. TaxID=2071632 RepID=UPI003F324E17